MDREGVKDFLRDVAGANIKLIDWPKWVSFHCIFAPWLHAKGKDATPSAGISVNEHAKSIYNCYGCHTKGPLHRILEKWASLTGEDWDEVIDALAEDETFGARIPEWGQTKASVVEDTLVPLDEAEYGDLYDPVRRHKYLRQRGISSATAERLELRFDPADSEGEPRILFPVRGVDGLLYGYTGRAIYPDARLKVRDYHGLKKRLLLLGAHNLADAEFVIVVEGLFDYALMVEYGYAAAAFMSSTLTPAQAEILKDVGKPVYFFHDNDPVNDQGFSPGEDARDKARELLCNHVPFLEVTYPKRRLRNRKTGATRALKDPAELWAEEVAEMIENARLV